MTLKSNTVNRQDRGGAVAIWVVLSLSVIVGIVAINLDGGRVMEERRVAQATADAAALAAASDLYVNYWNNFGLDPKGTAQAAAVALAEANGFPAGSVTVNIPPHSGSYAGQSGYAEVIIQTQIDASFGAIFTSQSLPVSARAVSCGQPMKIGIIVLQPNGSGALQNNSVALTVVNTPIIVNSSNPAAFIQNSFGVVVASQFDITGNWTNPGGALMTGQLNTGTQPVQDPLAFLPVPSGSVAATSPTKITSILPTILLPGVYQGGIHVTGAAVVVMQPGVYIMQGGGFVVDSLASVAGVGVMIYNTTSSAYATGTISISSLGKVALTAPTSGIYQGINFFQDRSLTTPVSLTGFGLAAITGTIYALQAPINLTGSATVGVDILGGAFVANTMTIGGLGAIQVNLGLNPPRVPNVRLTE